MRRKIAKFAGGVIAAIDEKKALLTQKFAVPFFIKFSFEILN